MANMSHGVIRSCQRSRGRHRAAYSAASLHIAETKPCRIGDNSMTIRQLPKPPPGFQKRRLAAHDPSAAWNRRRKHDRDMNSERMPSVRKAQDRLEQFRKPRIDVLLARHVAVMNTLLRGP